MTERDALRFSDKDWEAAEAIRYADDPQQPAIAPWQLPLVAAALAAAREREHAKIVAWLLGEMKYTYLSDFYAYLIERGEYNKPGDGA